MAAIPRMESILAPAFPILAVMFQHVLVLILLASVIPNEERPAPFPYNRN